MTAWSAASGAGVLSRRGASLAAREWSRIRLGCVAASVALFALAVVVLGALTPGYDQWSDTVSRLGSPGERWALATRLVFMIYGLLIITGAGTLRPSVGRHGRMLVLLLGLYGVARYGLTRRARRAAIVMVALTGLAAAVFRFTWGTPVYGLLERLVLGLGMGWVSALAAQALARVS
jgi:hypothetical protein